MSNNTTERLFLALWPNDNVRQAISQISQPITSGINSKIIPPENWHITLAFLGNIDMPTKQCMQQIAATMPDNRFSLFLDQLGYWPKPHILWLGASQTPDALLNLVTNITTDLPKCGYRPDTRPFQTHITLMRKVHVKMLPPITPIRWSVEDFCLVRSITDTKGARYQVIDRWLLK